MSDSTMKESTVSIPGAEYKGYLIKLDRKFMHFCTIIDEQDVSRASYHDLCAVIDDALKAKAKTEKIELPVVTEQGIRTTITGIHMGHSHLMGIDVRGSGSVVYPAVDTIIELVRQRNQIKERLDTLNRSLRLLSIVISRGYGRIDSFAYPRMIETLRKEYAEKTQLAQETSGVPS